MWATSASNGRRPKGQRVLMAGEGFEFLAQVTESA